LAFVIVSEEQGRCIIVRKNVSFSIDCFCSLHSEGSAETARRVSPFCPLFVSRDISVAVATRYGLEGPGKRNY